MTREEIINEIKCLLSELDNGEDAVSYLTQNDVKWLNENIKALEQESKWIPIVTRTLTDEDRKEYGAEIGFMYDCLLPEDSQDVLISTPYGVRQTTFYTDYGCYFENYEDEGDVIAWMPLPEPYKKVRGKICI